VKLFVLCSVIRNSNNKLIELRQIPSFLSIAQTLHFGRAAELSHLSQPALSLQIRALQHEIGIRLFERYRRKTALIAALPAERLEDLREVERKRELATKG
jgi:DNA-binding transcriptional LysR family regulator